MCPEHLAALVSRFVGRSVLITGGAGFLGANVVRALVSAGVVPHLVIHPRTSLWRLRDLTSDLVLHHGDLADEVPLSKVAEEIRPDIVFHLAVPRGCDDAARDEMLRMNVLCAASLIQLTRRLGISRVIVAGSSLEYGPSSVALREDSPLCPRTWHGATKGAASLLYQQAALAEGLPITVMRLFHVFGPWESGHRLTAAAIQAALLGESLSLTGPGIRRDWVFVDDVVEALLRAADAAEVAAAVLNIGTGKETTNEEFVADVESVTERRIRVAHGTYASRATDCAHRFADPSLAARLLDWRARHDVREGIRRTLEWRARFPGVWASEIGRPPSVT